MGKKWGHLVFAFDNDTGEQLINPRWYRGMSVDQAAEAVSIWLYEEGFQQEVRLELWYQQHEPIN